jgi:Lipase (class 3)
MALAPGFAPQEAIELLELAAFVEVGTLQPPIPDPRSRWDLIFDSPVMGSFDNKWQLWQRKENGPFAIAIRGTVAKADSIIEDLISLMIKAAGTITVSGASCSFRFAADPEAGVHLGFALGTLLLINEPTNGILVRLRERVPAGSDVYITGHSQGAAIATLLRSCLHYAGIVPANQACKTYVFAQPKPGNDHYAEDFDSLFCNPPMAFRVNNTLDWVPEVPFTLQMPQDIDAPNPLTVLASPSLLITLISKGLNEIRSLIEQHTRSRFQPMAVAVTQATFPATAAPAPQAALAIPFAAEFKASLEFVNAAIDVPLKGTPCVGAECHDALFEHHATTYYRLLAPPGIAAPNTVA